MKTDLKLKRDLLDELAWEPSIDAAEVGVLVHEGVVTLVGHVASHSQKYSAEEAVKRVHGVRAIANELEVRVIEHEQPDDSELATAAMHLLQWDSGVPADAIQVIVRDGWITLEGKTPLRHQREAAECAVRNLHGARGVTNNLLVAPPEWLSVQRRSAEEIKTAIENAIRRHATLQTCQVAVEVDGREVILTGDVHSHVERDEVERLAWRAQGVVHVENCISITPWGTIPETEWGY
jgi:osmotically-inducible protein OsmY